MGNALPKRGRRVESKSDLFGREDVAEGSSREGWGSLSRFQVEDLYKGAIQLPVCCHVNREYI